MNSLALELKNVTKLYGSFKAVDDLSLAIPAGSIYGFLGPNGAGKTTTIRMMLDIIRPTRGSVSILGRPSAMEVRDRIGYLPEEKGLYKTMKASGIIAYFAMLKGMSRRNAHERARQLLEQYGLGEFANAKVSALSKGMGQKVQVLASIVHDPEFVILDEPFSGLDPVNQQVMEQVIADLAGRGRTIIFSTHVMQHAERICDRILLIARGRKIFDGTLLEARKIIPPRVLIETPDDVSPLENLKGVVAIKPLNGQPKKENAASHSENGGQRWELQMREQADPQEVLQLCFSKGIRLRQFDHSPPTLHEVFVRLVGGASEAADETGQKE